MNIFRVDDDPQHAARALCDKHVVKMVLETAQLLSGVLAWYNLPYKYRKTHMQHPCAIWARQGRENYTWLALHGLELCHEYTYRYEKEHASTQVIVKALASRAQIPDGVTSEQPQCMPDEFKRTNVVDAYRAYYRGKRNLMKTVMTWKNRQKPEWFDEF